MRRLLLTAMLLVPAWVWAGGAGDRLAEAKRAAQALHYTEALRLLQSAEEAGDAVPPESADIYALEGELWAATGQPKRAVEAFSKALALNGAYAPRQGSPRIMAPFGQAKRAVPQPIQARVTLEAPSGKSARISVTVEGDSLRWVQGARLEPGGTALRRSPTEPSLYTGEAACSDSPCEVRVLLVDEWGNGLVEATARSAPPVPTPTLSTPLDLREPGSSAASPPPHRPLFKRPGIYLAAASVILVATGVAFGLKARSEQRALTAVNADRGNHTLAEARALDQHRKQHQNAMWVGLGTGAVAGGLAIWLW